MGTVIIDWTVAPLADAYSLVTNSKWRYQSLIGAKIDDTLMKFGVDGNTLESVVLILVIFWGRTGTLRFHDLTAFILSTLLSRYFKKLFVSDLQWTTFGYSFTIFSFIGTANQWVQQSRFWYFEHSLLLLVLFSPTQTKCGEPTGFEKMILPVIYRSKSSPFDMFLALQNHRDTIFLSSFFGAFLKRNTRVSRSGDYIWAFESVMPIYVADSIE